MAGRPDRSFTSTEGLPLHEVARVFPLLAKKPKDHRPRLTATSIAASNNSTTFTSGSPPPSSGKKTCGCLVPLSVAINARSCPMCDTPIHSVCDGLAMAAFGWLTPSENDNDETQDRPPPTVVGLDRNDPVVQLQPPRVAIVVKYGSRILSLGLPPTSEEGIRRTATTTAQARIAHVLGLDMSEMKVRWTEDGTTVGWDLFGLFMVRHVLWTLTTPVLSCFTGEYCHSLPLPLDSRQRQGVVPVIHPDRRSSLGPIARPFTNGFGDVVHETTSATNVASHQSISSRFGDPSYRRIVTTVQDTSVLLPMVGACVGTPILVCVEYRNRPGGRWHTYAGTICHGTTGPLQSRGHGVHPNSGLALARWRRNYPSSSSSSFATDASGKIFVVAGRCAAASPPPSTYSGAVAAARIERTNGQPNQRDQMPWPLGGAILCQCHASSHSHIPQSL